MMTELSLNVLDVAENSTRAGAALVEITVDADTEADRLSITIADNGCGMTPEQVAQVTDPFFTSRTTRKVGLGVPFFKYAADAACIIMAEGALLDEIAIKKARDQEITVMGTELPIFDAALKIYEKLKGQTV